MKDAKGCYKVGTDLQGTSLDLKLMKFYFKAVYEQVQFSYTHDLKNKINEVSFGLKKFN